MLKNGRMADVRIEETNFCLIVWADAGHKEKIESIEGVHYVSYTDGSCQYNVFLDPRYDKDYVKGMIGVILTNIAMKNRLEKNVEKTKFLW